MAECLARPDPQVLFDRLKDLFSANVLGGGTVIPESNEWYVVSNDYLISEEFYSVAAQQWRERDPRYACCENLVEMAALDGMYPRPATFAQSYMQFTGAPNSLIPAGGLTVLAYGNYFEPAPGTTVPDRIPADGRVIVRMIARTPGAIAKDNTTTARLVAALTGVNSTVTIAGGQLCGGQDAETCEQFRSRYLARKKYQPQLVLENIKRKAMDWPCLTRLCMRACNCCAAAGRLEMYALFDGTFQYGIPPQTVIDELNAWFFGVPQGLGLGQIDWGLFGQFYAPTALPVDVNIVGLDCNPTEQQSKIKSVIAGLFDGLCPGTTICRRMFDAALVPIVGASCAYQIGLTMGNVTTGTGAPCGTQCEPSGDITPSCDVLPVLGNIIFRSA